MIWDGFRMELLAAFVLIVVYVINSLWRSRNDKLPPGPFNIPLIGSFLMFASMPHIAAYKMTKKYGDVMRGKIGPKLGVSLNSARAIREAFSKPEFLGRPDEFASNLFEMKMPLFSSGKLWLEHRRFVLHGLRDLGLGKSRLHELIAEEIDFVLSKLAEAEGGPCNVRRILTPSASNNICSLVFGKRYDHNDPERIHLDQTLTNQAKFIRSAAILVLFPRLKKIPFLARLLKLDKLQEANEDLNRFVLNKIEEHKKTFDEHHLRDLIDIYLCEIKTRKERDPNTTLSDDCMPGTISNLFIAGSENIRASVEWALHTMALYPDIQNKVQEHLDHVIGFERKPRIEDLKNLPYLQAILAELQRWKTIAPIGPLRKTLKDVELFEYIIPEGTMVSANFWAAHNDPLYWNNPSEFNPERFLTAEGKYSNKHDHYLPFSMGKRACPGEGLALTEIFLYVASILQQFSVHFPGEKDPDLEEEFTFLYQLKKCELRFISRT